MWEGGAHGRVGHVGGQGTWEGGAHTHDTNCAADTLNSVCTSPQSTHFHFHLLSLSSLPPNTLSPPTPYLCFWIVD